MSQVSENQERGKGFLENVRRDDVLATVCQNDAVRIFEWISVPYQIGLL